MDISFFFKCRRRRYDTDFHRRSIDVRSILPTDVAHLRDVVLGRTAIPRPPSLLMCRATPLTGPLELLAIPTDLGVQVVSTDMVVEAKLPIAVAINTALLRCYASAPFETAVAEALWSANAMPPAASRLFIRLLVHAVPVFSPRALDMGSDPGSGPFPLLATLTEIIALPLSGYMSPLPNRVPHARLPNNGPLICPLVQKVGTTRFFL